MPNTRTLATLTLCVSTLALPVAGTLAEESAALKLIRNVQALQKEHGSYSPEVLPPLVQLGQLYGTGQCIHALEMLDLAVEISRRSDGILNPKLLEIYEPMINCYVTLDQPAELARAQRIVVLINEAQYGQDDPRMLPALADAARRYEEAGLYFSARRVHRRATEVASLAADGGDDLSLVAPLRGMARAYRLEYTYGLAVPDIADEEYLGSKLRSNAGSPIGALRFDRLGERSLERAVKILRKHPEVPRAELVDTLLELGDWHQLAGHRDEAIDAYRKAWHAINAEDAPESNLLRNAFPLRFRMRNGVPLRRSPVEGEQYEKYTIDLAYNVSSDGKVHNVEVVESNAPRRMIPRVIEDLKYTVHRPRFENGEPVGEQGLVYRRNVYERAKGERVALTFK